MKKVVFLSSIICLLLFSFPAHASSFVLSGETLSLIGNGFEQLTYASYPSVGYLPYLINGPANKIPLEQLAGKEITTTLSSSDITHVYSWDEIPYSTYENIKDTTFVNGAGYVIQTDNVVLIDYDNGYYHGKALIDSTTGDIVLRQSDNSYMCDIAIGGSRMSAQEWRTSYENLAEIVGENGFCYNTENDGVVNGNPNYYLWLGHATLSGVNTESLFVANQYCPGVTVAVNYQGWQNWICQWYTNDLSSFIYTHTGNGDYNFHVQQGDYTSGGYHYNYFVTHNVGTNLSNATLSNYEDWMADPHGAGVFANVGVGYDEDLLNKAIAYAPTNADALTVGEEYGLTGVDEYTEALEDSDDYVRNPAYDPFHTIGTQNKVITLEIETVVPAPVIDDEETEEDEEEEAAELEETDEVIVIPQTESFNVPIVKFLENHFPFSIPWDIKNMLKMLRERPKAPNFAISWYIRPIDYTWNFALDLSSFNGLAELFRILFTISYVLGLCIFSYNHFFGS